ncbi:MAG: polysaccharide biosynthesis/export family protein, partial [Pseudomonadota bacterium]
MEAMTGGARARAGWWSTLCLGALALMASVANAQLGVPELRQLGELGPAQRDQVLRSMGISQSDLAALLSQQGQATVPAESTALSEDNPLLQSPLLLDESLLEEPTLEADSTIVLGLRLPESEEEELTTVEDLPEFLAALIGQRTYQLDRYGRLHLQNVFHIPLAGLTEDQARQRVAAEPGLDVFTVTVTLLPLEDTGADALELFGSDFFARADSLLFNPAAVAVPGNYEIGPGDVLEVNLFGADGERMELTVDRDGRVALPQIGPVAVAGLSLDEVRNELRTRIGTQMIGVTTSVTIQRLRAIQVFVLGDVKQPGAYTVDSLTTVTNALLLGGGVRENGTLRRVQLKRDGRSVTTLDLYDLLLKGDTRNDQRLRNGDVVFVPSIGPVVGVEGEVNRAARYELRQAATVGDLLDLAGGLRADAQADAARLERILPSGGRTVVDVDLTSASGRAQALRNGDVLRVIPTSRRA